MINPVAYTNTEQKLPAYLRPIAEELRRVEEILSAQLDSRMQTVTSVSCHILDAGGKRLRPSLVILGAKACGGDCDSEKMLNAAATTELIHMATLMHDDVVDDANTRRGRSTANSVWGNKISILTGDYMLAKSFALLAHIGDHGVLDAMGRATIAMAEGEIQQIESIGDTEALTTHYLTTIKNKTAEFMSACSQIGAILARSSQEVEDALISYGLNLGIAFQITDDLLDLIGDTAQTGKPVGGDIREGKITMPLILALENAGQDEHTEVERIVHGGNVTSEDIEYIRNLAINTGAIDGTQAVAARFIQMAIDNLSILPPSDALESLKELPRHILNRRS